jgi:UDP-2,3-diacylglucosamine hydrolase
MTMPDKRVAALFISDLHLQASHPHTTEAFFRFLEQQATQARELYLLGDLFEYWAGDDDVDEPYHQTIVAALRRVGAAGVKLYWIAGNHGDAQCTEDVNYMAFRAQVRQPAWQAQFLAMPLAQRKAIIAGMRENSRKDQGNKSYEIMDVAPQAIAEVFARTGTDVMIHGHTHRPALHRVGATRRYVLPDWEPDATPPRGGWLAIDETGAVSRHDLGGAIVE